MTFTDGTLESASPLTVDYDGDGTTDFSLTPEAGETTVFDTTPPEATLALDPVKQALSVTGADNLSSTTVSTVATSSIITDEAGNTLEILFKKIKKEKHKFNLAISALSYNGAVTSTQAAVQYEWSENKSGSIKELEQKAETDTLTVEAHYDAKKGETRIEEKAKPDKRGDKGRHDEREKTQAKEIKKLPGLVILKLVTEAGNVRIEY